ncbi:hypothetical protein PMAYCL1PPCAC_24151 [Pristionchus mayeri]|uniref:Uncharacterized protein n=1 Tax=Pristionchus mayeri TaxID=1317129 RepID=A0AAN5I890_9BILA|nr:hypothetical protein PMAYCL1PPCAC_24151 [Pristionchus mayeri]
MTKRNIRSLTAQLIHRETIEGGGYAMDPSSSYQLNSEELVTCSETRAESVEGKDEFIVATSKFIARFRISLTSNEEAQIHREEEHDLRSLTPDQSSKNFLLAPSCISTNLPLNFILKAYNDSVHSLLLVHAVNSSLKCGKFGDKDPTKVHVLLPSLGLAILCGDEYISIVSNRSSDGSFQLSAEQNLEEFARTANPFPSPIKIIAIENRKERSATIYVISAWGTSIWKCTNEALTLHDSISEYSHHQNRETAVKMAEEAGRGERAEEKESSLRSLIKARVQAMNSMDELIDAIIIQPPKVASNVYELIISRKGGTLEVIVVDENEQSRLITILNHFSTLSSCPKAQSKDSSHVYIFSNNGRPDAKVLSIDEVAIECMHMSGKGNLNVLREELVEANQPIFKVTAFDAKFDENTNSTSILMGGKSGTLFLRVIEEWRSLSFKEEIHAEDNEISSIRFFSDYFSRGTGDSFAVLTPSTLRVYQMNFKKEITLIQSLHELKQIELKEYRMLTLGDGGVVHDVWLISDERVLLFIGRNQEYCKKPVELRLKEGRVTAISSVSSRKSLHESEYIDVVTIAKGSTIGILVALQMDEYPADVIEFTEWIMPKGSKTVGIHSELLMCERDGNGRHVLDLRVYLMKRSGTLHISLCRLIIGEEGIIIAKALLNMCKIGTSIIKPSQMAVSGRSLVVQKPHEEPPKYVIVSGSNGSQVVRVCPKIQLYSHSLDHIVFPSSVDTHLISDDDD